MNIKFQWNKEDFTIKRTHHLYEKRDGSSYQRDAFLDDTRFVKIIKLALQNGLKSFREKGEVVITLPAYNGKYYSILCTLNDKNKITIITVIQPKRFWKAFQKCHNRINIVYSRNPENLYKIPKMNEKEKGFKDLDSMFYTASKSGEDITFRNVMDNFLDYKIHF